MGRVAGKITLVTGAAGGIGEACARLLAREGATLVLTDIEDRKGEALRESLVADGSEALYRHLDVTREDAWIALMEEVLGRFGRLDVAVNNAGTGAKPLVSPSETPLAEWRELMSVNLDGVFLGTKHALDAMKRSDPVQGSIINMASIMALVGSPGIGAYNASKAGVRLYSKSVALSCAQEGISVRVNAVCPGFIDTPLLQKGIQRFADPVEGRRFYESLAPVGRLGEPDDVAYGVLYLASDESKFVTGADLIIDGGFTAR
jgi:NAD(P)-dependent dehydrogenase (short-subunit alcohol dehydrogenase family)